MATVTFLIGWTSQRPVIPDQHLSTVTVLLDVTDAVDNDDVRRAELAAGLDAYEAVLSRSQAKTTFAQLLPRPEMITSMKIVSEEL